MFRHALTRRVTFTTPKRHGDILRLAAQLRQLPSATERCARPSLVASVRAFSSAPSYRQTTADEPAATKKATKAKTGAAKKKTAAKKKPAKKAAPKPKPKKKVLTEEQRAVKEVRAKRDEIKKLRQEALLPSEPPLRSVNVFTMFVSERIRNGHGGPNALKELGPEYKQLSPAEREHYNHLANTQKAETTRNHASWVASHTPHQIRVANLARRLLNKRIEAGQTGSTVNKKTVRLIKDERQVKNPRSPLVFFVTERFGTGDFKGIAVPEAMKLITQEFKQLNEMEVKKYEALSEEDRARYAREFEQTYGYPPKSLSAKA